MKYLFVGGPPRSGTTALANFLNLHPGIAIGIERYKYLYAKKELQSQVGPNLFTPERFFAFNPAESNVRTVAYKNFSDIENKYRNVTWRGDKLPNILRHYQKLHRAFPAAHYIVIFRDIHRVCSSWNVRAMNEGGAWPRENDYRVAVPTVNKLAELALTLREKNPDHFTLVNYERLFGSGDTAILTRLLGRLDLQITPQLESAMTANSVQYAEIQAKQLITDAEQADYIEKTLDKSLMAEIDKYSI